MAEAETEKVADPTPSTSSEVVEESSSSFAEFYTEVIIVPHYRHVSCLLAVMLLHSLL